jgi:hypothetical protein
MQQIHRQLLNMLFQVVCVLFGCYNKADNILHMPTDEYCSEQGGHPRHLHAAVKAELHCLGG